MGEIAEARAVCRRCGARLSRYRAEGEPDGLCAPCASLSASPADTPLVVLEGDRLMLAVAGVLALGAALRPGERISVQTELARYGALVTNVDAHHAVDRLRRRYGWHVSANEGRPGYELRRWPWARRRASGGQLRLV